MTPDRDSVLRLAETLSALANEFAHDANNLAMQIVSANEILGDQLGAPLATPADLERITGYSRNINTIAKDLEALLERAVESGSQRD